VIGSLLIVGVPLPGLAPASEYGTTIIAPFVSVAATGSPGTSVAYHGGGQFFGIDLTDDAFQTKALVALGAYINTTPVTLIRFGGLGASNYDPSTQTSFVPPPSGSGRYVAVHQQLLNLTWFKSWCLSRNPTCTWEASLPGEENNTQAAIHTAQWFHQVLGLAPTYWEFGNEPKAWTDYGINMSRWNTADNVSPTGPDYATMVNNYITAISSLYPHDHYVGIEAGCSCNALLISATAAMDAPLLSSMAYHTYPIDSGSNTSLLQFYGTLRSGTNLSGTLSRFQQNIDKSCVSKACLTIPLEVGEYQAGPHQNFSPFETTYAGAPFLAASVIQGLESNASRFNVFDSIQLMNVSALTPTFEGLLYQRIIANLTMGADYPVTISAPNVGGVFAVITKNGAHESLFVVNTNTTLGLNLSLKGGLFPFGTLGSVYGWGPWRLVPSASNGVTLASYYRIPPQGILLLNNY